MSRLGKRLDALEAGRVDLRSAAMLMQSGQSEADALRAWEAANGPSQGEPIFIRLVGVKPSPRHAEAT